MAVRPAWKTTGTRVFSRDFSFEWNPGFAASQKKKNVANCEREFLLAICDVWTNVQKTCFCCCFSLWVVGQNSPQRRTEALTENQ